MNWEAAGAIGEMVGAMAVFFTLAYLAIQIRQNTRAVRASALDSSINAISAVREKLIESEEASSIFRRGSEDPKSLDDTELLRYRLIVTNVLWSVLNLHSQSKYANLSEDIWECQKPTIRRILNCPGGVWYWSEYKHELEETFVNEVDSILMGSTSEI